jgi:hypothetical protein
MRRLTLALALLCAGAAGAGATQLPLRINFQGKLLDPSTSLPKNGTFNLTFKIYAAATGGAALYTETQSNVAVNNGVFSVQIGSITPLNQELFSGASAYLGITVAPDSEMTPRQYLAMAPYSFTAMQLAQTGDIRINPGVAYSTFAATGNLFIAAGVTAGTATFTGGLTASSGTFTAAGASQYSLQTSSGIWMSSGTLSANGSGGVAVRYGVSAATGIFTATGASQYSLETSSGVKINAGVLDVNASGGVDVLFGVKAATFTGDGGDLTNIRVDMDSSTANNTYSVGTTEVVVATASFVPSRVGSRVLVLATAGLNRAANALSTWTLRLRYSNGSLCTTGSTLVGTFVNQHTVPNTAGTSNLVTWFKIHVPGQTAGQRIFYCMTEQTSTGTQSADERSIALLELQP